VKKVKKLFKILNTLFKIWGGKGNFRSSSAPSLLRFFASRFSRNPPQKLQKTRIRISFIF
jgi:hypothetical protein